jgi:hypothetical protein
VLFLKFEILIYFVYFKLLQKNPGERISLKDVRNHPWIVENADKNEEYMKYWKECN